jgi:cell division septum initiation protein DivIVA
LAKIESLQEQISEQEDEVERLEKELKCKERQLNDLNNQTTSKASKMKEDYEERLKI